MRGPVRPSERDWCGARELDASSAGRGAPSNAIGRPDANKSVTWSIFGMKLSFLSEGAIALIPNSISTHPIVSDTHLLLNVHTLWATQHHHFPGKQKSHYGLWSAAETWAKFMLPTTEERPLEKRRKRGLEANPFLDPCRLLGHDLLETCDLCLGWAELDWCWYRCNVLSIYVWPILAYPYP